MQGTAAGSTEVVSAVLTTDDLTETAIDARIWWVDSDTGEVYQRATLDGDAPEESVWVNVGKFAPPGDGVAPSKVTGVIVTPVSVQQSDGSFVPGFNISWDAVPETDILAYEVQYDLTGTTWATPHHARTGIGALSIVVTDIIGATAYDFRVRASDIDALVAPWSDTVTATSLADTDAPSIPDEVTVASGFKSLGIVWSRATEPDFAFFQVRYYDVTNPTAYEVVQTASSRAIITGLDPAITYGAQVRSVDRSGNVQTSLVDPTAVNYLVELEAGWSVEQQGVPSLIFPTDLALDTLIANFISTGELSGDVITSGTIRVGGVGSPTSVQVFDSEGNTLATWTDDGLVIVDPTDTTKALWLYGDSIQFTDAYTGDPGTTDWLTAIDSRGVNAAAILFGTESGGHNRIPNAGMEMAAFPSTVRTTKTWTLTTDWDDATSQVNLKTSGASLEMTAV